ncbi:MAG: Snf7 family protein [Nitrososphaerales archaeon]
MSDFKSSWVREDKKSLLDRVGGTFRSEKPLKPKLEKAERSIKMQIKRLESILNKLSQKDSKIFRKVVKALKLRNKARAAIFANELVELRKLENKIVRSKLALEQIALRIETATQMGDIVSLLTPATSIVRNIRSDLGGIMPEGNRAIDNISTMLNDILLDAGMTGGHSLNFQAANTEAERILEEASTIAEHRVSQQLPEIPSEIDIKDKETGILAT